MPVIIISALIISWLECFFILPNHLAHFVKSHKETYGTKLLKSFNLVYKKLLRICLKFRYIMALLVVAGMIGSLVFFAKHVKFSGNLQITNSKIKIFAELKQSKSLQETKKEIDVIEQWITKNLPMDKIDNIRTFIGGFNNNEVESPRKAWINVDISQSLTSPEKEKRPLIEKLKQALPQLKNDKYETLEIMEGNKEGEDKENMLTISVSGGDKLSFTDLQNEIHGLLKEINGVERIGIDPHLMAESWVFEENLKAMTLYKINSPDLSQQISNAIGPKKLRDFRLRGEQVVVYTYSGDAHKFDFEELKNIKILSPNGQAVPITLLGSWIKTSNLKEIVHEELLRVFSIDVKYNPDKIELKQINTMVDEKLDLLRNKYPAYKIILKDADEQGAQNKAWGLKVAALCLGSILLVLALTLGTISQPIIVSLPIPFAVIGVVWAIYFHGLELGLMAAVGILGVMGVAVNDSLIMVDAINKQNPNRRDRLSKEVLIAGASSRTRAILLTTVTTLGGVIPLAYGIGGESGFTQPLAFSMTWGLTSATVMTLFVLPVFLDIREDFKSMRIFLANKIAKGKTKREDKTLNG